ncbi:MAG: sugar ABC transporter permease [Treponema sp.]|nr:sugar ABC transporter permease [Treponema sp.]MBQ7166586.1 sugar ABC transporter permease [Treponema sp.]
MAKEKKKHTVQYDRWGYFFIAPFFIVYTIFSLIPLLTTLGNSFFENYRVGLMTVGPDWIGLENFKEVLDISEENNIIKYTGNTVIMWILGFIPQIVISLILSVWFTDTGLRLKFQQFFKTIIYMPNLIMASAFAMLFFTLFSDNGPMNSIFMSLGWIQEPIRFLVSTGWTRTLVAAMNFLMWYGNTTILLMAGIMGIDESLFEAARIDGASPLGIFFKITMPLLLPIFVYVLITSMIGGIQMFDVPQILTNGTGQPNRTTMTIIMYLNNHLFSKNYGVSGAISFLTFIVTAILSAIVYSSTMKQYSNSNGRR